MSLRRLIVLTLVMVVGLTIWKKEAFGERETPYAAAHRIIYTVFPRETADDALRVVGCETGNTYSTWSRNRRSGAAGWFQILPSHVKEPRRLFNPWFNSRVAFRLSRGGRDWSQWVCQP